MNRKKFLTRDPICNLMLKDYREPSPINKDKPWMRKLNIIKFDLPEGEGDPSMKSSKETPKNITVLNSFTKKIFLDVVLGEKVVSEISRSLKTGKEIIENKITNILEKIASETGPIGDLYCIVQGKKQICSEHLRTKFCL